MLLSIGARWRNQLSMPMLLAAAMCGSASLAHAQAPDQAEMQAHAAQMNHLGWQQSQQTMQANAQAAMQQQQEAAAAAAMAREAREYEKKRDWWAAVMIDTASGQWHASADHASTRAAAEATREGCGAACWPLVSFANTCMAPAYSARGGMFWAAGDGKREALAAAGAKCAAANAGVACTLDDKQAMCSGWKYHYGLLARTGVAGKVAAPKVELDPSGESFAAKPPARRGTGTVMQVDDGRNAASGKAITFAQPWTAIAVEQGGTAVGMDLGLTKDDAVGNALGKCGARCMTLVTFTEGGCGAVVDGKPSKAGVRNYGGDGATKTAAEEQAMERCVLASEPTCRIQVSQCMALKDTAQATAKRAREVQAAMERAQAARAASGQ